MATIELQHISLTYPGGVRAVRDLDLTAADGEMLVLVGPSGSGKTSVLRLIAGLERPTSGSIRIGDRAVNRVPPGDRDVAMVFQDYPLYPHLTVRKNLAFAPSLKGVPRAEIARRLADVARRLDLDDLLARRPGALSGGEQQRVAVGRAMVRRAACICYDEPLSNLDTDRRVRLRELIRDLHETTGTTTVYVTHDPEEAMSLGDRIGVLRGGALLQVGAPEEVYRRPADRHVAALLGSPPMNFVAGRVLAMDGGMVFRDENDGTHALPASFRVASEAAVILGVRPDAVRIAANGAAPAVGADEDQAARLEATVESSRFLGAEREIVTRTTSGNRIIARTREDFPIGARVRVLVPAASIHVFAADDAGLRVD
ncbi:MAG: ABC transporter ATP-binding protein [Planctomycetes bacterium]|nr:ABC transporter ATP-binding protein [Planctomycetota bacterium]